MERRAERVRSLLRLAAPATSPRVTIAAIVALALLVGIAAAQPVLERWEDKPERVDAQIFFALDTSRSMLASAGPNRPSRFDRAAAAARTMREQLGEVPVGLASMTDRVLPHLFPTTNQDSFENVLQWSIGVDRPPSDRAENRRATSLESTSFFASGNYFRGARRRVLVLFTDAESLRFRTEELTGEFAGKGIHTMLIRFWGPNERVYGPDGVEQAYVPEPASAENAQRYAQAVKGETLDEGNIAGATDWIRSNLGDESTVTTVKSVDIEPLGPYLLFAALLPLGFLLVRRNLA
jgi:hypothetical protein